MTEKGYKDGLVSKVRNKNSGKIYVVSTAQEIGKDYWSSNIIPTFFFGIFPRITKNIFTVIRNNKEDAHIAHAQIKQMIANVVENEWLLQLPNPEPEEGFTEQAKEVLRKKGVPEHLI